VLDSSGSATHTTTSIFTGQVGGPLENVYVGFEGILQGGETATFNISTNNVLTGDQLNTLASLNRFQEFGVFDGSNSVDLTLYVRGMGSGVTIQLNRNDTFEDMASKISLAMYNPEGNALFDTDIIANEEWPDLVHVNTIGNAKGTMSITTPIPGAELVFAGEEGLLKALSLVEVREGIAPTISINAYNLELGKSVGNLITTDNQIQGLIEGVDLRFDNTKGMRLDPEPPLEADGGANLGRKWLFPQPLERPEISVTTGYQDLFVHVAPQDFGLQIGANEGQTLKSVISSMDAESLGVEGLLVVSESLAQRAVSVVDRAISKVSEQRSQLGAIQNRLEATIRNLDVAAENLTASESRIRDVDLASTTVLMTQSQILMQTGVAALAQANQMSESVLQLLR
jgi:flagellin